MSFFKKYFVRVELFIALFFGLTAHVLSSTQYEDDAFKEKLAALERFLSRVPPDVE